MQEVIEKLKEQEELMAKEKGQFTLFALFLREDSSLDKWDLVVAADWIEKDRKSAMKYIADKVTSALSKQELRKLSHIAIINKDKPGLEEEIREVFEIKAINQDDPALKALRTGIGSARGARVTNYNFSGLQIRDAYLIEWNPPALS